MAGTTPGPAARPKLQVVREGNPGHKALREGGLGLPPEAPREPNWVQWFPAAARGAAKEPRALVNKRCREVARRAWRLIVPQLDSQGILVKIDALVLQDLCLVAARIDQAERDVSEHGIWVMGERGAQKNPSMTALHQLRTQFKFYSGQLGLTPVARDALTGGADDDDNSPYDV
jgi:P27 family predicted phage terminase small subunit